MKSNKKIYLFLYIGITLIILSIIVGFFLVKQKSKQPKSMNTLFTYNPQKEIGTENLISYNKAEPAFALKLPDGWYFDKNRTGNKRLIVQSPTTTIKGYEFRTIIMVSVVPTDNTLDTEVTIAKKEISKIAVNNKLLAAKPMTLNGYPAYQLEFTLKRERDAVNLEEIIGENGPFTKNLDIIAVKNGYFIDIAATAFFWQWKDYVATIEQSLNSFKFLE